MGSNSNSVFEDWFNSSSDAQLIIQNGKVIRSNPSALTMFGLTHSKELHNQDPFLNSPEFQPNGERSSLMAESYINESKSLGNARFEWVHQIGSEEIWTEYSLDKVVNAGSEIILAVIRNIDSNKRRQISTEQRIERLIRHNQALADLSALENDANFKLTSFKKGLLEVATSTLEANHASLWLKKSKKYHRDVSISNKSSCYDLRESIKLNEFPRFDRALLEHQLIVVNDSFKDPRSNEFKNLVNQNTGSSSLLIVPIISDSCLQGFLWIENTGNIKKWEFEEQSFAVSLGEMLAKQIGTVQKRKVERKLEKSEKVFRALVNHSLDVVCIIDKNGILTYQSPSFENVLGFGPNELLGKNAFEFIHPEDIKELKIKFLRLFSRHGTEDSFIYRAKHKNGQWVYVEALANNMLNEKEIDGIVVNIRDISERKEFQDQLQEQEQYYRTLIEKSLELTVVRDKNGIVTYVSPSVESVFGLKEQELVGKRNVVQTHKEDLDQFEIDWQYLLKHPEKTLKIDQRIVLPNGKLRHVEGMARNLLNVKPVNGIVMNFRDVSSRKNAENALIESQMRLEGIISSALDAIITVDSNQNIVLFNNAAENMFKQNAFEVFGKPMELLIPKEARKRHKKYIKAFQGSTKDQQRMGSSGRQLHGLKSDGSTFPIDASISKQTIEDEVFFTAVIRDTTEQIKSEQVLKEYNKTLEGEVEARTRLLNRKNVELNNTLEELRNTQEQLVESEKMASLGQLTAGIAHEINNPINFVTSTISPLKRDFHTVKKMVSGRNGNDFRKSVADQSKEINFLFGEITQLLNGIEEGAKRTKNIVLGLRNFSRLDEESFKKANLEEGLDSTLMLLNSKLRGQIDIEKNYGGIPPVECLPGKINQVFMNILSNAIQAIKSKGLISISTSHNNDHISIHISDSGHGMSKQVQKRVFEPFFTTKDVGIGTGLGLSISYGIIDNHGGTIEVESKPGKGTTFAISLPVSQL